MSLNSYADFLNTSNELQAKRQLLEHSVRQVEKDCFLKHRPEAMTVLPKYALLDNIISQKDNYTNYVLSDEEKHTDGKPLTPKEIFYFTRYLHLSVPIDVLRYDPGGST